MAENENGRNRIENANGANAIGAMPQAIPYLPHEVNRSQRIGVKRKAYMPKKHVMKQVKKVGKVPSDKDWAPRKKGHT